MLLAVVDEKRALGKFKAWRDTIAEPTIRQGSWLDRRQRMRAR
jgi:hypothetical protein